MLLFGQFICHFLFLVLLLPLIHPHTCVYLCMYNFWSSIRIEFRVLWNFKARTRNTKLKREVFFLVKEREKVENIMLLFSTLRKASIVFAPLNYTCTHRTSYFIWSFFFTTTSYFVWSLPACNFNHNFMQTPMSDLQGTGLVLEYHRVK